MSPISPPEAAKVLLSIRVPRHGSTPSSPKKRISAWCLFIQDPQVNTYIMSRRRHPEHLVLQHYTSVAKWLWERVKKDKVMYAQWQARADHINSSRCHQRKHEKPRLVCRMGPNGTQTVDFYEPGSYKRWTKGPSRIVYGKEGNILKVFVSASSKLA